jgi:hypothetical protein
MTIAARTGYIRNTPPPAYDPGFFNNELQAIQRSMPPVTIRTAAYTADGKDFLILANAAGGAFSVTLPLASRVKGMAVTIKRLNSGANAVTIARSGSDTIDGAASVSLSAQYASRTVASDGSAWHIIASV